MESETQFEAGDDVYVIDSAFVNGVVHEGTVGVVDSDGPYESIAVVFDTDPFTGEDEPRRLGCEPVQVVHRDADMDEIDAFLGIDG